jgi:predicted RNA-binding Zn-ribbon protein involved in translation (DUF1610 family)
MEKDTEVMASLISQMPTHLTERMRFKAAYTLIIKKARKGFSFECFNCGTRYVERAVVNPYDCPNCGYNVIPKLMV